MTAAALVPSYGAVVERVNVSVLLYEPLRSASLAATDCLNAIVTASWAISFGYVSIVSGLALPVTGAKADVVCAELVA